MFEGVIQRLALDCNSKCHEAWGGAAQEPAENGQSDKETKDLAIRREDSSFYQAIGEDHAQNKSGSHD